MLVALVGIVGVVLGGLLNATVSYRLARRGERRELRTAARLLLPELQSNREALEAARRHEDWNCATFETRRWREHELAVVTAMESEWVKLTAVYKAFELLNTDRQIRLDEGWRPGNEMEGDDIDYLDLTLETLEEAIEVMRRWAGVTAGESLRIQEYFWV